jgi:hypothetical protein
VKTKVVFSHGFGVGKDDRGLFTDIIDGLSLNEPVLFDYGLRSGSEVTFPSLRKQAEVLNNNLKKLYQNDPGHGPILICHSQGCLVASLADLSGIKKLIFLAPPMQLNLDRLSAVFGSREGSIINPLGQTRLARRDGTTTIVVPDYWKDIKEINPIELFNKIQNPVTVIIATQDEVLGDDAFPFEPLNPNIDVVRMNANHDFTGNARAELISKLKELVD